jgi:hypothetical protein
MKECSKPIVRRDESLHEQGVFPSTLNRDHKWTFTTHKHQRWSERSVNVLDLVRQLREQAELLRVEQLSSTYHYDLPRYDQTLMPVGEVGIAFVIHKRTAAEVQNRGRWRRPEAQPVPDIRIHPNQYRDDLQALKRSNVATPPFQNDTEP